MTLWKNTKGSIAEEMENIPPASLIKQIKVKNFIPLQIEQIGNTWYDCQGIPWQPVKKCPFDQECENRNHREMCRHCSHNQINS